MSGNENSRLVADGGRYLGNLRNAVGVVCGIEEGECRDAELSAFECESDTLVNRELLEAGGKGFGDECRDCLVNFSEGYCVGVVCGKSFDAEDEKGD